MGLLIESLQNQWMTMPILEMANNNNAHYWLRCCKIYCSPVKGVFPFSKAKPQFSAKIVAIQFTI